MSRVLVTGTSSGIGEYTAHYLLKQHVEVIGVSRREPSPELRANSLYTHVRGDLTSKETVSQIGEVCAQKPLTGAVFNAGILDAVDKVPNLDLEAFKKVFEVNLYSVIALTKVIVPLLLKTKGNAIYVSSGASTHPYTGWAAYGSSKAALNLVAASLANEEPEITVLAVAPGVVDTSMQSLIRGTHAGAGQMGDDAERFMNLKKEGKLVKPEDSGSLYGRLALRAPHELSGQYLRYDDPQIAKI